MGSPTTNQFLSDTERLLASPRNITATLQNVARATVPHLADFCLIFLVRSNGLPCVACAHTTREGERLLRGLNRVYKITRDSPESTVADVVRTGRAHVRREIGAEPDTSRTDPQVLALHRQLGPRSALVVPIGVAPNVLGAITLAYTSSGRHYTALDLPVARRLATLVAASLGQPARRLIRLRARVRA